MIARAAAFSRPAPLRIALVTETYPPEINGVAMTLQRLVAALVLRGHTVQLIRPRQGSIDRARSDDGLSEVLLPSVGIPGYAGLRAGLPAGRRLAAAWNARPPNVVHVATEGPLGWSAMAAAGDLGLPVTSSFHTNFHSYSAHYGLGFMRRPIRAYLRRFHNRAAATLVPTEALREELDRCGFLNLHVVARGVDTQLYTPSRRDPQLRHAWGADESTTVALYVGRMAPEKNLPLIMHAYAAMRARDSRTRLVMVGDGPSRRAIAAGNPGVVFAGSRTGEDLAAHYASADVFLFPSVTETFGNVTLEAMASGLATASLLTR
ncbi:MAG TPA: glycosyltransferase family 1 protein [Burkholderiales bacterium]|nr:glycosyltransferase family 1 protein [Burkholderiales bacterium]